MAKSNYMLAALLVSSLAAGSAAAQEYNPVDTISNEPQLPYSEVGIAPRDMDAPFVRDGIVRDPSGFRALVAGLTEDQVEGLLGAALAKNSRDWDYNFKFKMPQSDNYLVCQYKVRFDANKLVETSVWRRRQCQALVIGSLDV